MKNPARMSIPDHPCIAHPQAACLACPMEIRNRGAQAPFTTKDGSTIRSLLDASNAPVAKQSLAEATLQAGAATDRHYHRLSEEFYYLLEGCGLMEIDGEEREVGSGDAVLIPAGAWHQIRAIEPLQFLCCCAPPYAHEDTYFE
jgi:mannose-6-phosphate isomerase-like protein (cupin superfamily)